MPPVAEREDVLLLIVIYLLNDLALESLVNLTITQLLQLVDLISHLLVLSLLQLQKRTVLKLSQSQIFSYMRQDEVPFNEHEPFCRRSVQVFVQITDLMQGLSDVLSNGEAFLDCEHLVFVRAIPVLKSGLYCFLFLFLLPQVVLFDQLLLQLCFGLEPLLILLKNN